MTTVFEDRVRAAMERRERPAGDAGSAASRIVLAVHGLDRGPMELALADACHRLGVRLVPEPYQTPPGVLDPHGDRRRHDGGHVSGILARVVDLLAQCSGEGERRQVLDAAAAFHGHDWMAAGPED